MHSSVSLAAKGRTSARRASEEPNLLLVSDVRNDPKACATTSGIVIICPAASLLDHDSPKARLARILRRVTDAEGKSQSDKEQCCQFAFTQVTGEACRGLVVVFEK